MQSEPDDFMLGTEFQRGISYLNEFDLTYDILVFTSQLPAAIKLAHKFPDQKFVVDHIAKPLIKDGTLLFIYSPQETYLQSSKILN